MRSSEPVASVQTAEQSRALWMSTIAFTVCFAVWTIFSIIGVRIKEELGLSETQFGILVGMPILTGSLVRMVLGIWTDRFGGRLVYTLTMLTGALATALLSFAHTYQQMLLAALGVGIAGGSFAVGVAYVSRFYPSSKQGTALGIFGVGNVGAAVTKFLAPLVLLAWGWQSVALIWAAALVVMAIVFWFTTNDDPVIRERRAGKAAPARSFWQEFAPLKNLQVWRFAFYYFFAFGAFVALSLWLPRYLIGVYGFGIATAGMIGAAYSIPASIFRAYGGVLSDRIGARTVLYWTFSVSAVATLVLSLPSADYVVRGISGPIPFHFEIGPLAFIAIASVQALYAAE
jgi:NNP family nitrate/nitrite transporter-like MFS transporter